jgi:acetyl-CoA acetyltransferase
VRIGEGDLLDSLLVDGAPVAAEAERLLQCHGLCAADLEAWIESSRRKASAARAVRGSEFAPLAVIRRGSPHEVTDDEGPETARVPLPRHLAAPADGAAALLLSDTIPSGTAPLARILDWVETGSGWTEAIRRLLHKLRLPLESIDRWEIHEPSAAHALALLKDFPALDPARVNARGGALAIGDPLGASGARLLLSLAQELEAHRLQTGIAVIPGATGMALAMAISRS